MKAKEAEKPLFIPLKHTFFLMFRLGSKDTEFRPYGSRWNERTCRIGRRVTLSKGYGKHDRLYGIITAFKRSHEPTKTEAWRQCYGEHFAGDAACITIGEITEQEPIAHDHP